jgi:PAS domain S-box-containing protein
VSASPDVSERERHTGHEPDVRPQVRTGTTAAPGVSIPAGGDAHGVQLALEAMDIAVFEHDSSAAVPRLSAPCRQMLGLSDTQELTPALILARIHPEDRPAAAPVWLPGTAAAGGPYAIEHRVLLSDGTIRWLKVCGHLQQAPDGGLCGCGVARDITSSMLAQQALQECDAQLQAFVAGTPAPCAILDRDMRFLAVTERHAQDHHRCAAEMIGATAQEVFPAGPPHWRDAQRAALAGTVQRCDCDPIIRSDGTRGWLRWELRPWQGADGTVGGVILFCQDITRRVQAEQALRDSRARLELAIHAGQLGVYEHDLNTGVIVMDARLRELFGFTPEETVSYEKCLQRVHPQDRERIARQTRAAAGAGNGSVFKADFRVVNSPGAAVRWLAFIGRVSCEDHVRMAGCARDITARKRTELALQETTRELRRDDRRKDVYLATLAHELRNPLSPICTVADLLSSPNLPPGQLEWMSQVLSRQSAQMVSLLEDLLEISRICSGRLQLKKQDVPLLSVVHSAFESVQPLIAEKHQRLHVDLPDPPPLIHVDPARLLQVLSNLLANAAKYTDPGGNIWLSCTLAARDLVVRVKDSGIGIARDALERIFTLFWQADRRSEHSRGGLGIGLAFARDIAGLHGGSLRAHSDGPGHGSEFILRLPACVRTTPAGTARAAAVHPAPAPLNPHRVLVADDDKDAAEALEMLLTVAGHEVRVAHGGQEALSAARDFHPDVAVLDLAMPGLDGCDVARVLRRESWASELRLIALTGWGQPDVLRRASDAGFDAQIVKPADPDRLCSMVEG